MAAKEWLYNTGQAEPQGPVTIDELAALATVGQLQPDDLIWKQGMDDWLPAGKFSELGFASQPTEQPASASPPLETHRHRSTKTTKAGLTRWLVGAGVGISCVLVVCVLLVFSVAWFRPPSSVAEDYSIDEIQRMHYLIQTKPELTDSRLGSNFRVGHVSVELWRRLFGEPIEKTGLKERPKWTYQCANGTITYLIRLPKSSEGEVPYLLAKEISTKQTGPERLVDSDRLLTTMLRIKKSIDPADSVKFEKELIAQQNAENKKRQAEFREELNQNTAFENEKALLAKDQFVALNEWDDLRPASHTPAGKALSESQAEDWMDRRAAAIARARQTGEIVVERSWDGAPNYKGKLPLPTPEQIAAAINSGDVLPIIPEQTTNGSVATKESSDDLEAANMPPSTVKPQNLVTIHRVKFTNTPDHRGNAVWVGKEENMRVNRGPMGNWLYDRPVARIFSREIEGTVPLAIHFKDGKGHTYTVGVAPPDGYSEPGKTLGWIWPEEREDTMPLYHMKFETEGFYSYTLVTGIENREELEDDGWEEIGLLGYVYNPLLIESK